MKMQVLAGGLANQMRHYIFVRFAQRYKPGDRWVFDDSDIFIYNHHNGYELERVFGLKLNLLSENCSKKDWDYIIEQGKKGILPPQSLLDMGYPIVLFEGRLYRDQAKFSGKTVRPEGEHLGFHPEYLDLPYENIYYNAEWASKKWFDAYAKENMEELRFPALTDSRNLKYQDQICNCYAVGIHVRRTGFLDDGLELEAEPYLHACKEVLEAHPDACFFIFSDDLEWCQKYAAECGFTLAKETVYVYGNTEPNNYIDMQLLSMCRGMIRNLESSFSQVAGWLNPNLEFDMKLKPQNQP